MKAGRRETMMWFAGVVFILGLLIYGLGFVLGNQFGQARGVYDVGRADVRSDTAADPLLDWHRHYSYSERITEGGYGRAGTSCSRNKKGSEST